MSEHKSLAKQITTNNLHWHVLFLAIVGCSAYFSVTTLKASLLWEREVLMKAVKLGEERLELEILKNRNETVSNRGVGLRIEDRQDQILALIAQIQADIAALQPQPEPTLSTQPSQ